VPKLDAFGFADYSQIELRLLAYYMAVLGDDSMARAFREGKDMHTESAKGALRIGHEPSDEERQVGKTFNYSITYGGGTPTLMRQLGVTYAEARDLLNGFHDRWPGIRVVQDSIAAQILSRGFGISLAAATRQVMQARYKERQRLFLEAIERGGYITTLFGRHLHPESEHKALNALVQGCAADLLRFSTVRVARFLREEQLESHIVNLIHDEIKFDCVTHELPVLAMNVPILMTDGRIEEYVPITVDFEVSYGSWADKQPYEEGAYV